ncbi:bacteriocin-like protein [Chryseobacterium gwangjuense]
MKNLKKISRENLKTVKGGYTQECVDNMYAMGCQINPAPGLTYTSIPGCPISVKRYCLV